MTVPKTGVLPLHHGPIPIQPFRLRVQMYNIFFILQIFPKKILKKLLKRNRKQKNSFFVGEYRKIKIQYEFIQL